MVLDFHKNEIHFGVTEYPKKIFLTMFIGKNLLVKEFQDFFQNRSNFRTDKSCVQIGKMLPV